MSNTEINLGLRLASQFYGPIVEKVLAILLRQGPTPLKLIALETGLVLDNVRKALCVLLQHNLVTYDLNSKGFVEYSSEVKKILLLNRYPRYIYSAKTLYGDAGELLIEEILQHGQLEMSRAVDLVTARLNEAYENNKPVSEGDVKEKFVCLAQTHFIERCPVASKDKVSGSLVPKMELKAEEMYEIPNIPGKRKRKRSDDDNPPAKRAKTDDNEDLPDKGILWRVNFTRFEQYLRDQVIIDTVSKKIDQKCADVLRTLLRLSELVSDSKAPVTNAVTSNEIHSALTKEMPMTKAVLDQCLKILSEDSLDFVTKVGDSGGGSYCISFKKAFTSLCKLHLQSVIQERFGSKSVRIFRLLLLKKHLEQKQIEDLAMVPAKEAKQILYRMFGENFLHLTEVPKMPDHTPSRTFYLFSVELNSLSRLLLQRCYKTMSNMIFRRNYEVKEHKRVLDKQARVDAILSSLEQQGAEDTQKAEIEEMITPSEKTQIQKVKNITNKMENAELQLDSTIFVLQTFLLYDHSK